MDSSVSPKDEIWFLCVCHHISNAVYPLTRLNGAPEDHNGYLKRRVVFRFHVKKIYFVVVLGEIRPFDAWQLMLREDVSV
jgi:hypothetical protein